MLVLTCALFMSLALIFKHWKQNHIFKKREGGRRQQEGRKKVVTSMIKVASNVTKMLLFIVFKDRSHSANNHLTHAQLVCVCSMPTPLLQQ